MIICKAPLRLSFFGGSTDYKSFYEEHGSFIIGTTIDKYVYVSLRMRPQIVSDKSIITYSKQEIVECCDWDKIEHPLIREALKFYDVKFAIDLHTFADIPSRTGLGGSSAFCAALIKALSGYINPPNMYIRKQAVARFCIHLEREILNEKGGLQDQIWAAYGGFNTIEINREGEFKVKPLPISREFKKEFEDSLILVYTGSQRNTSTVAEEHDNKNKDKYKIEMREISYKAYDSFLNEDIKNLGHLLELSWERKKEISPLISNKNVDNICLKLKKFGCYGTKLCGAGDGGFVLGIGPKKAIQKAKSFYIDRNFDVGFSSGGVQNVFKG